MALPFIFANSADGRQLAANLDTNFAAVALNTVIPCTASGTNSITLTPNATAPNQTPTISSYINKLVFSFEAAAASTGPVTIRVGGLAFKAAYRLDGTTALGVNDISAGLYLAVYSSALAAGAGGFYVTGGASLSGGIPATVPPLMDGVAMVGTTTKYAREDHIHPSDTSRAPLASPALTGTPTVPTAAPATNTTQAASTAFVTAAVAAGGGGAGGLSVTVADTLPAGAADNSLWWESDSGNMYLRYNDGNSTQWVPVTLGLGGGGGGGSGGGVMIDAIRVVTAAGAVTVSSTDHVVVVNKTTGAATAVALPASPATGREIIIKDGKGDAGTNNITITPAAGNIDGGATTVIATNYRSLTLIYNGAEWSLI